MKLITTLVFSFFFSGLFAQHTPQEIKNFKISKILRESVSSDAPASFEKYDDRYDKSGNQIATYIDGQQFTRSVNEYDNAGRLVKTTLYGTTGTGNEATSNTVYTYSADGSCVSKLTDLNFKTVAYQWFDNAGRIVKTMTPEKIEDIYTYNAAGQLISIITKPGTSNGDITDLKYTYNTKGQRSKEVSAGSYPWTRMYTYDIKGMLSKVVTVSSEEGVTIKTTDTYKYAFWQ